MELGVVCDSEIEKGTLLGEYRNRLEKTGINTLVEEVRILGSFGRSDGDIVSDLDVWLVVDSSKKWKLPALADLAIKEKNLRKKLGEEFGFKNLDRHLPSVFTSKERDFYQNAFAVRVGVPAELGGQKFLKITKDIPNVNKGSRAFVSDEVVSFTEYMANHKRSNGKVKEKWLRRMVQDMEYLRYGNECIRNSDANRVFNSRYSGDENLVLDETRGYVVDLLSQVEIPDIRGGELIHTLGWTLEKVRWEMMNAQNSEEYLHKWRVGKEKVLGFNPRQIGNLISDVVVFCGNSIPGTAKIGKEMVELTRENFDSSKLSEIHDHLSSWLLDAGNEVLGFNENQVSETSAFVIPTSSGEIETIRRVGVGRSSRFVISEMMALEMLNEDNFIVTKLRKDNLSWIDVKDFGGRPVNDGDLSERIGEYAGIIKRLHQHDVSFFGRLGGEIYDDNYQEYLQRRVAGVKLPEDIKLGLESLIKVQADELRMISPVLCHMDPGPRNMVVTKQGDLRLFDFEHASGCAAEWDVERILLQLPDNLRSEFEIAYYGTDKTPDIARLVTRAVMLATFAGGLPSEDTGMREKHFQYVRTGLKLFEVLDKSDGMFMTETENWFRWPPSETMKV